MSNDLIQAAQKLFGLIPQGKEPAAEALLALPVLSFKQRQFLWRTIKRYEFSLGMLGLKVPPEPLPPIQLPSEPHFIDFVRNLFILRLGHQHAMHIHMVPKAKFDKATGLYSVPYRLLPVLELHKFVKATGLYYTEAAKAAILDMYREMKNRYKWSMAHDAELDVQGFALPLDPYQVAGIKAASLFRRGFIADSMGLGKTRQGLGVLHLAQQFPALVVCPASVVINWEKEAVEGLTHPDALRLTRNGKPFYIWRAKTKGTPKHTCARARQLSLLEPHRFDDSCSACCFQQADLIIANYHKLADGWKCQYDKDGKKIKGRKREKGERAEVQLSPLGLAIKNRQIRAIILDEVQYVKNEAAQMTKAVAEIINSGNPVIRLALSGTPIKNRVSELISPLKLLDRLDDLGGEDVFCRRFCDSNDEGIEGRLNKMLRAIGFVQRNKRDVRKDLPPIRYATQWVDIDNREEYKRVEEDLVNWMAEQAVLKDEFRKMLEELPPDQQDAAVRRKMIETRLRVMRAQALIKVGALKRVTAKGKVTAIVEWLDDFLTSEKKIVVYVHHRHIQKTLIERYNCLHIVGEDSQELRQKHKEIFQGESGNFEGLNEQIIVISDAAREGVSLDAADDIVRVELPWSPADEDQIIARVDRHRAHNITAYNLVADDTIEIKIVALLQKKRKVVDGVTKGGATPGEIERAKADNGIDDLIDDIAAMSTNKISGEEARARAEQALLEQIPDEQQEQIA